MRALGRRRGRDRRAKAKVRLILFSRLCSRWRWSVSHGRLTDGDGAKVCAVGQGVCHESGCKVSLVLTATAKRLNVNV